MKTLKARRQKNVSEQQTIEKHKSQKQKIKQAYSTNNEQPKSIKLGAGMLEANLMFHQLCKPKNNGQLKK